MKISNIMVALLATSGLFLTTPGWSKQPANVNSAGLRPVSQKVLMCHRGLQAINISLNAQYAHEAHGDWAVDDASPCPAAEGTAAPSACLEVSCGNFDIDAVNYVLADLSGPLFDIQEGLLYLPQVKINMLGITQTFAVILERVNDTDFVVRYVEFLPEPLGGVAFVEFDGASTVVPFDVDVTGGDPGLTAITEVELSVLRGCRPVQLSATNFAIPSDTSNP